MSLREVVAKGVTLFLYVKKRESTRDQSSLLSQIAVPEKHVI